MVRPQVWGGRGDGGGSGGGSVGGSVGGSGGGGEDGDGGLDLLEADWVGLSRNQRRNWLRRGGRRRIVAVPRGESAPSPTAGDDDDRHLPGH